MWTDISFSGVLKHLSILQKEKRKLYILKESVETLQSMDDVDIVKLHEAMDGIDRLIRSTNRKHFYLEDLVQEFRQRKQEAEFELDELENMLNSYLEIEYSETD